MNPFQQVGFCVLLVFLFVLFSRVFDLGFYYLHISAFAWGLTLAASFFSGAFVRAFSSRIGKSLLLFTIWAILAVPFSYWKGGSFRFITSAWLFSFVVYVAVAGLIGSYAQCRKAIFTVAFAVSVLSLIALSLGSTENGRLFLAGGKFQNPNDLAQALLIGLPWCWLLGKRSASTPVPKILALLGSISILMALFRTGSRGGLAGFAVICFLTFVSVSFEGKLKLFIAGALVLALAVGLLPSRVKRRYFTLFKVEEATVQVDQSILDPSTLEGIAAVSADERRRLLKESVILTFRHPLFGVGAGNFNLAAQSTIAEHRADAVSHNSYTQISSENGIPGLIFYFGALVYCVKGTTSVRKFALQRKTPEWQDVAQTAFYLRLSLLGFATTAFFASVAYQSFFPVLMGLGAALSRSLEPDMVSETVPSGDQSIAASNGPVRPLGARYPAEVNASA